ncbi:MAG TPA: cation:proton antiporter [Thermoanaerobaculia bacterium]|nr:cation:proton antiporter [Thermoanaerobaculia bacterium]
MIEIFANSGLTIGLALVMGILAQSIAQHLRIPSIVVLLATGAILGPDGLGIIQPESLGDSLQSLVGFAVSVILFEGAMNLDMKKLRHQARSIQQLSTIGVLITAAGATLATWLILGWSLPLSILCGALLTVTGPTVITPLVRRMRLQSRIATVLQAEGIFVDAVGTVLSVVALEIVIGGEHASITMGPWYAVARLGAGTLIGSVGGLIIAGLLRSSRIIPEGMHRVFALAMVIAIFQISNAVISESGIMAVVAAGLVVGNIRSHALIELREFKEQLTMMLIGLLFVLLAAHVRLEDLHDLGWPAFWFVIVLMFLIRPLNVFVGTLGTDLNVREKSFLAFLAPRGIVAAALASLFAETLRSGDIEGGRELRALVFLVIAVTVVVAGLFGGTVARLLGLRRGSVSGYVILGANPLGRTLAAILKRGGEEVLLIDSNPHSCRAAESEGLRVLYGSGLSESVQQRAELDARAGAVGLTSNDEVNLLFVRRALKHYKVPRVWVSIRRGQLNVTPQMVSDFQGHVLFGRPRSIDRWNSRLEKQSNSFDTWRRTGDSLPIAQMFEDSDINLYLPFALQRGKRTMPVDEQTVFRRADLLHISIWERSRSDAEARLEKTGWSLVRRAVPSGAGADGLAEDEETLPRKPTRKPDPRVPSDT